MNTSGHITTLFLDIGGVLLTNGWCRRVRKYAAEAFQLDYQELDSRHHLTYDTFESGKLTLDEYLDRIVFYQERPFTKAEFTKFMFDQTKPFQNMIDCICALKSRYELKIAVISNEARELNAYRIQHFQLGRFVDFFICSCFVHLRKPDTDIYRMALDIAQVRPEEVLYIEDRAMFVQVAKTLGLNTHLHTDYESTYQKLSSLGLRL
jgi:putative hydrolase of the HAD superfamily